MEKLLSTVSHKALFFYWHRTKQKKCYLVQEKKMSTFTALYPKDTLFVCLLDTALIPKKDRPVDAGLYIYCLIDVGGQTMGQYFDSTIAFEEARENGYAPQWSH